MKICDLRHKTRSLQTGLRMNFRVPVLRDGLKRVVLNYDPSAPPRLGGSPPDLRT